MQVITSAIDSRDGVFIGENNGTPTTPFNFKHMAASVFLTAPNDLGHTIRGKGGHDHINGANGNDILRGGSGDDEIEGSRVTDIERIH